MTKSTYISPRLLSSDEEDDYDENNFKDQINNLTDMLNVLTIRLDSLTEEFDKLQKKTVPKIKIEKILIMKDFKQNQ